MCDDDGRIEGLRVTMKELKCRLPLTHGNLREAEGDFLMGPRDVIGIDMWLPQLDVDCGLGGGLW